MRPIRTTALSSRQKASLPGRFRFPRTAGYYSRPAVQISCHVRHWSSGPLRLAQNGTSLKDSKYDLDALNRFTSGRWLWGERAQLAARYVKFDMPKLCRLAASAIGSESCVEILKISEGQYNKVFLLTMDDGREVIAKLPNPNAGRPHFTTASEVATMNFLRNVLRLPIPRIYAWNSRLSNNPVGAEYVVMKNSLAEIVKHVVGFEKTPTSTKFTKFGGLYYKQDLPQSDSTTPLYIDVNGSPVHSAEFEIGPTKDDSFFDFGKGELDIDRGPWSTIEEFVTAIAHREIACVKKGLMYSHMPDGLFYGPRQYQPSASTKLSALTNYLEVAPNVLPEPKATHTSVLWHGDLHSQKIFVDPGEPTQILGIIDWQSVSASPLFMQVTRLAFLDFNGPIPEAMSTISLPESFETLSADEQRAVRELHQAQTLHNIYIALCVEENPDAFMAMQQNGSLRHQATVVPSTILMHYEPYLNNLLRDVEKEWPNIVGLGVDGHPLIKCPLQFSAVEIEQQEKMEDLWAEGLQLMNTFIDDAGGFKHWDGTVSNEDYGPLKAKLASGIERFLNREARNAEERAAWLKVLPFVDHD